MIALVRNTDNRVMNERQGSDWPATKKAQIIKLQDDLENTPETEPQKIQAIQQAIDVLLDQWQAWLLRRREICANQYGGVASDYSTVDVPSESEQNFMTARYVEYDGNSLTFDISPPYYVEGGVITCTSGWVRENERLIDDDITNFSGETLTEPLFFRLWYAQNNATQEISVQLLVRNEDEEFSDLPGNLTKRGKYTVCEGRVNVDNSITIGVF